MNAVAETVRRYSVHEYPVFCAACEGEIRVPEVVARDPLTGRPAHGDCAKKPRRAFNLMTGEVYPAARRYLPERRS